VWIAQHTAHDLILHVVAVMFGVLSVACLAALLLGWLFMRPDWIVPKDLRGKDGLLAKGR
jgi:hypothetical protein